MNRFDTISYDEAHKATQQDMRSACACVEALIERHCNNSPRAKALALTKLEECYMWIGKAVRDDQLFVGGTKINPWGDEK